MTVQKDQKQKQNLEIFQLFLNQISTNLNNNAIFAIFDLIADKATLFNDIIENIEWSGIENLKIENLNKLSIPIYNYLAFKSTKSDKNVYKSFENLAHLIESIVTMPGSPFNEEIILIFLTDFVEFYLKNVNSSRKEEAKELFEGILSVLYEESSK